MRASSYAGPMVARALAQQALAMRLHRLAELQAVAFASGGAHAGSWGPSLAASRATTSQRFASGAGCDCGERSCESCERHNDGLAPCPCGNASCVTCSRPRAGSLGVAFPGWPSPGLPTQRPPSWEPHDRPRDDGVVTFEYPESTPVVLDGTYFDMHSHNFAFTRADWETARSGAPGTTTEQRADWLHDLHDDGIGAMAISGMVQPTPEGYTGPALIRDTSTVNEVTLYVAARYPEFFAPFLQLVPLGGASSGEEYGTFAVTYVDTMLRVFPFQGVGELVVHGHGVDVNTNAQLYPICRIAATYGIPVMCHWEIAGLESELTRTSRENFDQLIELLESFPNEPVETFTARYEGDPIRDDVLVPLKFILCHCGAGPTDLTAGSPEFREYASRLDRLLKLDNVYFDLAGMQVYREHGQLLDPPRTGPVSPSALGAFLLTKMAAHPNRFLLGLDCQNTSSAQIADYGASVDNYATLLGLGALTTSAKADIRWRNAFRVLYSRATLSTFPHASVGPYPAAVLSWPP